MNKTDLQKRTKVFALQIIKMVQLLPNNRVGWTFSDQIVRSSTSVAANYRAVCRAKSDKDFISKMETVIEEADESLFWLEMIEESGVIGDLEFRNDDFKTSSNPQTQDQRPQITKSQSEIINLKREANELVSIFVSSAKTVKARLNSNQKSTKIIKGGKS